MKARRIRETGFTLIELMIVMAAIGVLMLVAVPKYATSLRLARESVLREDLQVMRDAIDSYTMDKQKSPQSLDDLVQEGYLRQIPVDPMTHSSESWITDTGSALRSVDQSDSGIDSVHSGSDEAGSNGQAYSTW